MVPLNFAGGGYVASGKAMFDSEGNLWVGNNFSPNSPQVVRRSVMRCSV